MTVRFRSNDSFVPDTLALIRQEPERLHEDEEAELAVMLMHTRRHRDKSKGRCHQDQDRHRQYPHQIKARRSRHQQLLNNPEGQQHKDMLDSISPRIHLKLMPFIKRFYA